MVIYGLPRGGVIVAVEVARLLEGPLDLIVVRKIGHPFHPEYAVGAIAEDGYIVTNRAEIANLDKAWFDRAAAAQRQEARRRRGCFLQGRSRLPVQGKIAIVVDDGLATGSTMLAAVNEVRKRGPKEVVVAVPVAAAETVQAIRSQVDDLVVLEIPQGWFGAIGNFYDDFEQVDDEEVIAAVHSIAPLEVH